MPCRENADLFWWLKRLGIRKTFNKRIWKSSYFWHDTFGVRWNRLLGCKLGHKHVEAVEDEIGNMNSKWHCFACHCDLGKADKGADEIGRSS